MNFFIKKNKKSNKIIKMALGGTLLFVPLLASCSQAQMDSYWDAHGGEENFEVSNGKVLHISDTEKRYTVIGNLSDICLYGAQEACKEANRFSNINITFSNVNVYSDFVFDNYTTTKGVYVTNDFEYYSSTGEIYASTILYNDFLMSFCTQDEAVHSSLHAMGATLGLKELNDDNLKGYSVMYNPIDAAGITFTTFGEWDINNILSYYGGTYS